MSKKYASAQPKSHSKPAPTTMTALGKKEAEYAADASLSVERSTKDLQAILGSSLELGRSLDELGSIDGIGAVSHLNESSLMQASLTQLSVEDAQATVKNNAGFLNQLEGMMAAVKKEAAAIEGMKAKLKEMEEIKRKNSDLKRKLAEACDESYGLKNKLQDFENNFDGMREDMQRLNDLYTSERSKCIDLQQELTRLDQERSGLIHERDFFNDETLKIPDLKKAAKTAKSQTARIQLQLEEEQTHWKNKEDQLDKKVIMLQNQKQEVLEELGVTTTQLEESRASEQEVKGLLESKQRDLDDKTLVHKRSVDRLVMLWEDLHSSTAIRREKEARHGERVEEMEAKIRELDRNLQYKESEHSTLASNYKRREESYQNHVTAYNVNLSAMQQSVKDLTKKNQELVKDQMASENKLGTVDHTLSDQAEEIERLKGHMLQTESIASSREAELSQTIRLITSQREEHAQHLEEVTAKMQSLLASSKAEQTKHWTEVKELKSNEAALLEEAEKLAQELHEMSVKVHTLEAERGTMESNMRGEVSTASQLTNTLRGELERRLEDLVKLRKERDEVRDEKDALLKQTETLHSTITKNEASFKKTIETDRAKMKHELVNRTSRIKSLEAEKQELLSETAGFMKQLSEQQVEAQELRRTSEEAAGTVKGLQDQCLTLGVRNSELNAEIKSRTGSEQTLTEKHAREEKQRKEEIVKLELLVKEGKKSASVQMMELTNQLKSMHEELEEVRYSPTIPYYSLLTIPYYSLLLPAQAAEVSLHGS